MRIKRRPSRAAVLHYLKVKKGLCPFRTPGFFKTEKVEGRATGSARGARIGQRDIGDLFGDWIGGQGMRVGLEVLGIFHFLPASAQIDFSPEKLDLYPIFWLPGTQ